MLNVEFADLNEDKLCLKCSNSYIDEGAIKCKYAHKTVNNFMSFFCPSYQPSIPSNITEYSNEYVKGATDAWNAVKEFTDMSSIERKNTFDKSINTIESFLNQDPILAISALKDKKCYSCIHCEVCKYIDTREGYGCEMYDRGGR